MPDIDVIKNTLELLETMEEGIIYIEDKLKDLKLEETTNVLSDIIGAYSAVESALIAIKDNIGENQIEIKSDIFRGQLDTLLTDYEKNSGQRAYEILTVSVKPAFQAWKREIEMSLRPFVVS